MSKLAQWAIAVAALAVAAQAGPFEYKDQSPTADDPDFALRKNTMEQVTISIGPLSYDDTCAWASINLEASQSSTHASANADALAAFVTKPGDTPPVAVLGYVTSNVSVEPNLPGVQKFFLEGDIGIVGLAFLNIVEKDAAGEVVDTIELTKKMEMEEASTTTGDLKAYTLKMDEPKKMDELKLHIISSSNKGEVKYDTGSNHITFPAIPKSLELLLELNNYNYEDDTNKLTLQVLALTYRPTLGRNFYTRAVMSMLRGKKDVFAAFGQKAYVDGQEKDVQLSNFDQDGEHLKELVFKGIVSTILQGEFDFREINITFPAGAKNILYDPSVGQSVHADSSACLAPLGLLLLVLAALALH